MKQPKLQSDENTRWQAVLERDSAYDGKFVYGVRSTGIYCRPTCPSRRPRQDQVMFFDRPENAQKAGFRACKRCQPDAPLSPAADLAAQARRMIDAAVDEGQPAPKLKDLSELISISPYHLQRTFRSVMGISPRQYAAARRAIRLRAELRAGTPVTHSLYEAGYGSASRFYETTSQTLGMRPDEYRRGGAGMQITYTIVETPPQYEGCLLLAATPRGICSVQFGSNLVELEAALASEFPHAERIRDDAALREWASILCDHLAGTRTAIELPLDVQGTVFQQRVWAELRRIPYGQTRTYTQIAEAIQQPTAARAVARACATNPAALVIPCHRVVRAGGELAGYRWGIQRKKALIEHEKSSG
jgi:AraC family transcriptional regulator of adaptative response/methylated-DNA-[protein]-cysteine methyltransferase